MYHVHLPDMGFNLALQQAAALAACQQLTAELGQQPSVLMDDDSSDEDDNNFLNMPSLPQLPALNGVTGPAGAVGGLGPGYLPPPQSSIVARLQKMRKLKPPPPLPSPIVVQIVEMGFNRKRVETALKALGKSS